MKKTNKRTFKPVWKKGKKKKEIKEKGSVQGFEICNVKGSLKGGKKKKKR